MWDNPRLVEDKARGDWPRICVTGALSPTSCSQIQRWGYLGRGTTEVGLRLDPGPGLPCGQSPAGLAGMSCRGRGPGRQAPGGARPYP